MSISASLNSAISGLAATSKMAEVVSNNLANALTDGYGKREVLTSSARLGGVNVDGVRRSVDPVALGERRLADASLAGSKRTAVSTAQVEAAIGSSDDQYGISSRLIAFEQSLISAAADPASEQRLALSASRLGDLVSSISQASDKIQTLRAEADRNIATDVEVLNAALSKVESLNVAIVRTKTSGGDTNPLFDERQKAVDQISQIVPIRELERSNDTIALMSTSGSILLDGKAAQLEFQPTPTIVADMEYSNGVLGGLSVDGVPLSTTTGYGRLDGGSIAASFELRDTILVEAQSNLDGFAADLVSRFEKASADPTLGPTDPGLLTDNGARFDPSAIVGLSTRLSINGLVDPDQGGDVSLLRDGMNASIPAQLGDSTQISNWISALNDQHSYAVGGTARSAHSLAGHLSNQASSDRLRAEERATFEEARWGLLKEAELADGVDSDAELQRLLIIEQAYAANAKLVQAATSMLQTLMEI